MAIPTTFLPALDAIQGVISGTLGAFFTSSVGQYTLGKSWEGQTVEQWSRAAQSSDNIIISYGASQNQNRWQETYDQSIYDLDLKIIFQTNFSGTVLTDSDRKIAQALMFNKVSKLRTILSNPGNLRQDTSGNDTGMSSGMLSFVGWDLPKWKWEDGAYGESSLNFTTIITIRKT